MKTLYNSSLENLYQRRHFDEAGTSHDGVMEVKMEKVRGCLQLSREESESVSRLNIHPHRVGVDCSFYEYFTLRGIRVERVEPGLVSCSFTIPPRLTDINGNLANGAIANLVDEFGGAVVHVEGLPMKVSVDMSISFLSTAKVNHRMS
ncbi:uncharacterized protein LOC123201148 isoform X2 [Mangifera indica]|uniref:uncharacterized protein LOC123201148 isoform X2 n=1 Tax=Mangifera indica TaxID=29780 RepID=UPI001CFB9ACB|nr:uncharacterized protein LOC123201148 isoform X2 [Mangifera indica]